LPAIITSILNDRSTYGKTFLINRYISGIGSKDEVEKTMKKLDAECAAACSTATSKSAETASAPLPKAVNA